MDQAEVDLRKIKGTFIELCGVSFTYPTGVRALSDIFLHVKEGEFVVVCGPTGCGKSTLLMTINGLIPHTIKGTLAGRVKVAGKDTRESSVAQLATLVGTVLQNPEAQIFSLTCDDEIAFGLENLALPRDEIQKRLGGVLSLLSLKNLRHRSTAKLSGGEKQKLVIAATLAMGSRVLVLDEPLSDLDPQGKGTVLETLAQLNREGMTIIVAEHNLDLALGYATRMFVMEEGRIIFDGEPRGILARHHRELTKMGVRLPQTVEASLRLSQDGICLSAEELAPSLKGMPLPVVRGELQTPPILKAEGLGYTYREEIEALRDVSFSLGEGVIALVGSNGAGKSTLARILVGLLKPSRGDAFIRDESIRKLGLRKLAQRCGFLFQNPDLQLLYDTVDEELLSCLTHSKDRGDKVSEVLHKLDLQHYRNRDPQSLSRGQRQRLALATALVRYPEVLILDEPTTGQDWRHIAGLMKVIKEEVERGALVLMITHDMRLVAEYAEKVLVFDSGRLVAEGEPRQIFSQSPLLEEAGLELPPLAEASFLAGLGSPFLSAKELRIGG